MVNSLEQMRMEKDTGTN